MTEIVLLLVIVFLIGFIVWTEMRHEKHIKELEDKIKKSYPTEVYQPKSDSKPVSVSPILKQDQNEIMLNEIPFMEIPKDFKIEHEGSPETPAEAVARKS